MNSTAGVILRLRGYSVRRGATPVVRDIDLDIAEGDVLALAGRNGAGKTSLLEGLAGLHSDSGAALMAGVPLAGTPGTRLATGLSLCPEGRALFAGRSVWDNLLLGGSLLSASEAELRARATAARFPLLHERRRQRAGSLSGGEQQIVAVCRSLIMSPRLLLLDSPTAGLAPAYRSAIEDVVRGFATDRGHAVVIADDDLPFALGLATRVLGLVGGSAAFLHEGTLRPAIVASRLLEAERGGTP